MHGEHSVPGSSHREADSLTLTWRKTCATKADHIMDTFSISKPCRRTGTPSKLARSRPQERAPMRDAHRGREKGSPRKLQPHAQLLEAGRGLTVDSTFSLQGVPKKLHASQRKSSLMSLCRTSEGAAASSMQAFQRISGQSQTFEDAI